MSNTIDLSIAGRSYKLAAEPAQVPRLKAVASRINDVMEKINAGGSLERDRQFVLTLLTLVDDLITLEQEKATRDQTLEAFHTHIASRLEKLAG
jgi:cell division protein ZapA (FtsZ GTPase activity inhibitor)